MSLHSPPLDPARLGQRLETPTAAGASRGGRAAAEQLLPDESSATPIDFEPDSYLQETGALPGAPVAVATPSSDATVDELSLNSLRDVSFPATPELELQHAALDAVAPQP